jgi:hypothetical protein
VPILKEQSKDKQKTKGLTIMQLRIKNFSQMAPSKELKPPKSSKEVLKIIKKKEETHPKPHKANVTSIPKKDTKSKTR